MPSSVTIAHGSFLVAYCMGVGDLSKRQCSRVLVIFRTGQDFQLVLGCILLARAGLSGMFRCFANTFGEGPLLMQVPCRRYVILFFRVQTSEMFNSFVL